MKIKRCLNLYICKPDICINIWDSGVTKPSPCLIRLTAAILSEITSNIILYL